MNGSTAFSRTGFCFAPVGFACVFMFLFILGKENIHGDALVDFPIFFDSNLRKNIKKFNIYCFYAYIILVFKNNYKCSFNIRFN